MDPEPQTPHRVARGARRLAAWRPPRRHRRRLVVAGLAVAAGVLFAAQQAPYAQVSPGPTPDLTSAVVEAQEDAGLGDPELGSTGRLLGTTVNATQLSWFGTVRCAITHCPMLPVDTSDQATVDAAAAQMTASQRDAAAEARRLTHGRADYPDATLSANLGNVGGPSAGLMLTLTFVDVLTGGDLTGGRTIAGTGTIDVNGRVGPIAGAAQKVVGAHRAGATVFFTPAAELAAVRAAAPEGITVVPVETDQDALRWLCEHGGTSTACPTSAS